MKRGIGLLFTAVCTIAFAHEGAHGPTVNDPAKQGGVVAPVIETKDAKLGSKAPLVYKGELVRSEDGSVRVYLYDAKMNPLKLDAFDKTASGMLETRGKKAKSIGFELQLDGDAFVGNAPKPPKKPFNIDVTLKEKEKSLLVAFDNLD